MNNIVFRWAVWNTTPISVFMLSHSIASFQRFFGSAARYVVFADDPVAVNSLKLCSFELHELLVEGSPFADSRCTWRKWAPRPRLDSRSVEMRIDSDVFLLTDPVEIRAFCDRRVGQKWIATQEEFAADWPYGNFAPRLGQHFIPINAGFIGQAPGCDITLDLEEAYRWWSGNISESEIKYHDEQGAVAFCLQAPARVGDVHLLDHRTHRVVCPLNEPPVRSVDGLVLLHATYPEHPAFFKFFHDIAAVTGLSGTIPR